MRIAVRVALATTTVLLVAFVVRSLALPAQSAAVFIAFEEGTTRPSAPTNPLFDTGELRFAGYEPVQLGGTDLGVWDEVVIIDFDRTPDYEAFVDQLDRSASIARYHLLSVSPEAPELLLFTNWRLRGFRDDRSIEPGEAVPIDAVVPDTAYLDRWQRLFDGGYRDEIVMLNLLHHAENPEDPVNEASDASAEELYARYSDRATRLLGKLGGQILVLGSVENVVAGPSLRHYDVYAFVFYPSVDIFEVMFTAKERVEAQVYQRAGLSAERSAGYWVKPYPDFVPVDH